MQAYIYRAALICEDCASVATWAWQAANPKQPVPEDSDAYPQGPYSDGGGEADYPVHCDHCGLFLENPLTRDGVEYVREQLAEAGPDLNDPHHGKSDVLTTWRDFYSQELEHTPRRA